jgi:MinD superfamily P-loop ATPase
MSFVDFTKTQITAVPHIVDERCATCRKCAARKVCKSKAIIQLDPDEAPFIDASRCYGCHLCLTACPYDAIALQREPAPI